MIDRDPVGLDGEFADLREASDGPAARAHREEVRARLFGGRVAERDNRIDRYEIVRRIGKGGAGTVYEAHDPVVGRSVAVKLVGHLGATDERGFFREAMTLARLDHPNVVTVYDAGVCEAGAYIVMELLDGASLLQWLRASRDRSWREVVAMFVAVGDGLTACHEVGLLHADFKPGNVGLTAEAVPKLLDFGLARRLGPGATAGDVDGGTPAYMPPEQFGQGDIDVRADVYAFCVALYRALYGVLPFRMRADVAGLYSAKLREAIDAPAVRPAVAPTIERIVRQGLSAAREDRPESIRAVTAVLRRALADRRRVWSGAAAVLAVAVGVGAGAWSLARSERPLACTGADAAWQHRLSADYLVKVGASLDAQGARGKDAARRLLPRLRGWETRWHESYEQACRLRLDDDSPTIGDGRVACFEDAREAFAAMVEVLSSADDDVSSADALVEALPDPDRCLDGAPLSVPAPPHAIEDQVEAANRRYARARADLIAGRLDEAYEGMDAVVAEAERLEFRPLITRGLLGRAGVLRARDMGPAGDADASRALTIALADGYDELTFAGASFLLRSMNGRDEVDGRANAFADVSHGMVHHASAHALGNFLNVLGGMAWRGSTEQDLEEAARLFRRSADAELGGSPEQEARAGPPLANLAMVLSGLHRYEEAEAAARQSIELQARGRGEYHPLTGKAHNALGTVLRMQGRVAESVEVFGRYEHTQRLNYGPEHPAVLGATMNVLWGRLEVEGGAAVADELERLVSHEAVDPFGKALGRSMLGLALLDAGQPERAQVVLRRSIDELTSVVGSEHVRTSQARVRLARALLRLGQIDEATTLVRRGLEHLRAHHPPEHEDVLYARNVRAELRDRQGRRADAEHELAELVRIPVLSGDAKREVALARLQLAQWSARRGQHDSAEQLAAEALVDLVAFHGDGHASVTEARVLLRSIAKGRRP